MWFRRSLRYLDDRIEEPGGGSPNGSRRIILLVHGYNNDKQQAEESYEALMRHLPEEQPHIADQVWWLFWPSYVEPVSGTALDYRISVSGSEVGTESNSALSVPTYAWQVLKARDVGRELGRYLRELQQGDDAPTEVVFVAHSLGCRVVLEALRELLDGSTDEAERDRVPCVCLMAAAVPTFMVDEGARLEQAATLPQATYILHSRADMVLRWAFRGGQGAASLLLTLGFGGDDGAAVPDEGEGVYPEAVGRYGNPTAVWLRRAETGLGHSGYWTHPSTAPNVLRALNGQPVADVTPSSTVEGIVWTLPTHPDLPDWSIRQASNRHQPSRRTLG
jgi:hypothetical protein